MICYHQRLGGRPTPPPPGQCCPGFCSVPRATCPSSYYCAFASAKTLCPAGFRCPAGASAPANCTVGYYCPVATFQPILCGTGSYCQVGSAAPAYCQEGYYCPSPATQIVCPLGSFCVRGAVTYKACTGLASGMYCPAGSSTLATNLNHHERLEEQTQPERLGEHNFNLNDPDSGLNRRRKFPPLHSYPLQKKNLWHDPPAAGGGSKSLHSGSPT